MDFIFTQFLLITLLLAVVPAVTAGYLLDLRRTRIAKQPTLSVLSRPEILALAMAWILGGINCWLIFMQKELNISYAISAVALIAFVMISKSRRENLMIKKGSRWYVGLVTLMILATFIGVVIRSEPIMWFSGFLWAILLSYEIWTRILGLAK